MVNDHSITFFGKFVLKEFGKFKKKKIALMSVMVRDRAKRTEFWDHMHGQWWPHNIFEHLKKHKFSHIYFVLMFKCTSASMQTGLYLFFGLVFWHNIKNVLD